MSQNKVSAVLTAQAITNITGAITTIRANIPFLLNLTPEQRKRQQSITESSQGIVLASLNFAAQHPEALPAAFNTAEFKKDGDLLAPLQQIESLVAQLKQDVDDTLKGLQGDLYSEFLDVYAYAKAANRNGAYDEFINNVKGRFSSGPHKAKPVTT
jgi:hypothetical protein